LKLVIFSDLDGTLLDRKTYQPGPAQGSLQKCRRLNIPVILVSGKTKSEMEEIRKDLGLDFPFISENGGGLYIPINQAAKIVNAKKSGPYLCLTADETIEELRKALSYCAKTTDVQVRTFGAMSVEEISAITGLNPGQALLAKQREFDEPFLIIDDTLDKIKILREEIAMRGYRYNFGGSLHHITGNFNKGERVRQLQALYCDESPGVKFAAVGDAYNDLPMLKLADYPFLVRKPDGTVDENVIFDDLTIPDKSGPAGFTTAVEIMIKKLDLTG
jgi:mannosyl-3-phosphoglycerate phosphatase